MNDSVKNSDKRKKDEKKPIDIPGYSGVKNRIDFFEKQGIEEESAPVATGKKFHKPSTAATTPAKTSVAEKNPAATAAPSVSATIPAAAVIPSITVKNAATTTTPSSLNSANDTVTFSASHKPAINEQAVIATQFSAAKAALQQTNTSAPVAAQHPLGIEENIVASRRAALERLFGQRHEQSEDVSTGKKWKRPAAPKPENSELHFATPKNRSTDSEVLIEPIFARSNLAIANLVDFSQLNAISEGEKRKIGLIVEHLLEDYEKLLNILERGKDTLSKEQKQQIQQQLNLLNRHIDEGCDLLSQNTVFKVINYQGNRIWKTTADAATNNSALDYNANGVHANHRANKVVLEGQQLANLESREKLEVIGRHFDQFAENHNETITVTAKSIDTLMYLAMRAKYSLIPAAQLNLQYKPPAGKEHTHEDLAILESLGIRPGTNGHFTAGKPEALYNMLKKNPDPTVPNYAPELRNGLRSHYEELKAELGAKRSDLSTARQEVKATKFKHMYRPSNPMQAAAVQTGVAEEPTIVIPNRTIQIKP